VVQFVAIVRLLLGSDSGFFGPLHLPVLRMNPTPRQMRSSRRERLARFLSWFLRHGGADFIDPAGWCCLDDLLKQPRVIDLGMGRHKEDLDRELEEIVNGDKKRRFQRNAVGDIRACFGHSLTNVNVWEEVADKDYPERVAHRSHHWTVILSDGNLRPMSRQMIHLLPLDKLNDKDMWNVRGQVGVFVLPPGTKLYRSPQGGLLGALEPIPVTKLECALDVLGFESPRDCACNGCSGRYRV
jgi:RNA 2'-phosphotransferase, Tpt1 / KptA family